MKWWCKSSARYSWGFHTYVIFFYPNGLQITATPQQFLVTERVIRWQPDSDADSEKILPLPEASKDNIKNNIVHMMCVTPPEVQRQLSEALSIISKHDFPAKWPAVVPELVSRMGSKEQGTVSLTLPFFLKTFSPDSMYCVLRCWEPF